MRRLALSLGFVIACLVTQGCGGGAVPAVPPPGGVADRITSLAEISTETQTLTNENFQGNASAILATLRARSDVESATLVEDADSNTIQVWLKSGPMLVIARNRPLGPSSSAATLAREKSRSAGYALPNGTQATAFFSFADPLFTDSSTACLGVLRQAGYTAATTPKKGSIDDYKALGDAGILMIESHGVPVELDKSTREQGIALMTSVTPTPELDALYKDDLADHSLAYINAGGADGTKYLITSRFVRKYVKVAPQAFVFLNTCHSLAKQDLAQAFLDAGAGVVFGWTKPVEDVHAAETAFFLFDKLAGTTSLAPKLNATQQPPLDWDAAFAAARQTNRAGSGVWTLDTSLRGKTKLAVLSKPNSLGTLLPSIESALANAENNTITLTGRFGFVAGSALGNPTGSKVNLAVSKWGPTSVTIPLVAGVTSVQLAVNGIKGPVFPLLGTYTISGPLRTPFEVRDQIEVSVGSVAVFSGTGASIPPVVFQAIPGQKVRVKISTTKSFGGSSDLYITPPSGTPYAIRPKAFDLLPNPSTGVISDLEYSLIP